MGKSIAKIWFLTLAAKLDETKIAIEIINGVNVIKK